MASFPESIKRHRLMSDCTEFLGGKSNFGELFRLVQPISCAARALPVA
jgi:hypothetical protein